MKRDIDTSSPEWRHICEVNFVLQLRKLDRNRAHAYLDRVTKARGEDAGRKLELDAAEAWKKENA